MRLTSTDRDCGTSNSTSTLEDQPSGHRASAWNEERVESLLCQMTVEEKVDLLSGVDGFYVRGVPRLGVPRFRMADGPLGMRVTDGSLGTPIVGPATAMPGGIALAATWNPALAEQVGAEIGAEARARGVHFLLGPGVNIYRAPMNGRNFEYFGEDPLLVSRIAVAYIQGVQRNGVCATVKHFLGNNSEFDRHHVDSIIDERAMREIYMPAFEAAVREAGVGAIMDAYNLTNGEHMTQNGHLNDRVLKRDWGFDGIVVADWFSVHDALAAVNGGLDLEMPSSIYLTRENLLPALENGAISISTIDDKVRRILRVAVRFGWLDREQANYSVPACNFRARKVALQTARESIVLLKNEGSLLPLRRNAIRSIAVIGPIAYPAVSSGGGSARVTPFAAISFLEGIGNYLGTTASVHHHPGIPSLANLAGATKFFTAAENGRPGLVAEFFEDDRLSGTPVSTRTHAHLNFDLRGSTIFPEQTLSDRWTGYYRPERPGPHNVFVQSSGELGGHYRLYVDDRLVFDSWKFAIATVSTTSVNLDGPVHRFVLEHHGRAHWGARLRLGVASHDSIVHEQAKLLAAQADAVVVALGFDHDTESETADRTFHLPPGQEQLVHAIRTANENTIVVITGGGAVDMNSWLGRVPALLHAWYPGQEGGAALAEILFGEVNPSGRLPATFERRWEDNPVHESYYPQKDSPEVVYKEGVFVGYRGYERNGVRPLFPFGYGLSYTTFAFNDLSITTETKDADGLRAWQAEVSCSITNTGDTAGAEVAQVYVAGPRSPVERPAKELKGFAKVCLQAGETRRVRIALDQRALSYFDVGAGQWRATPGEYQVLVGNSSQDIHLQGRFILSASELYGR